jgi:predicted Zn finger-like uncharacterized protein
MVMTVECPECGTAFPVDSGKVPASGVRAQCSVCPGIFPVFPFESDPDAWKGEASVAAEAAVESVAEPEVGEEPEALVEPEVAPEPEPSWEREPEPVAEAVVEPELEPEAVVEPEPTWEPEPVDEPVSPPAPPEPPTETVEAPGPIRFGKRDPHEKAKRLARVLVSDMIVYHREKHTRALEAGTLAVEFEEEVEKSWEEYVDQIGSELAESTPYFREALNEILAKGEEIF